MRRSPCLVLGAALGASVWAEPVDEAALFADTTMLDTTILNRTQRPLARSASDDSSRLQVRFGGSVTAQGQGNHRTGALPLMSGTDGSARVVGTTELDVSLASHQRALLVGEIDHEGSADTTSFHLREGFVDFELGKVVWLRAGKQVLQWGRGLLWTPTDLVNVEGKSLVARTGSQEGATGLRVLVPVGQNSNLTGFLNLTKVTASDSLSYALRMEGLLGPVEVAASGWSKPSHHVGAAGLDASTGFQGIDIQGGALWISGDLQPHAVLRDGKWALEEDHSQQQVRASFGVGKGFRVSGVPDRLRIDVEAYWNSRGYGAHFLQGDSLAYADTVPVNLPSNLSKLIASNPLLASQLHGSTSGYAADFAIENGLYQTNQWGRAYVASMASFKQFILDDLTLSLEGLVNVQDKSGLGVLGLAWSGLHGFFWQSDLYWFWGDSRTEFALSGTGPAVDLRVGIQF